MVWRLYNEENSFMFSWWGTHSLSNKLTMTATTITRRLFFPFLVLLLLLLIVATHRKNASEQKSLQFTCYPTILFIVSETLSRQSFSFFAHRFRCNCVTAHTMNEWIKTTIIIITIGQCLYTYLRWLIIKCAYFIIVLVDLCFYHFTSHKTFHIQMKDDSKQISTQFSHIFDHI